MAKGKVRVIPASKAKPQRKKVHRIKRIPSSKVSPDSTQVINCLKLSIHRELMNIQ